MFAIDRAGRLPQLYHRSGSCATIFTAGRFPQRACANRLPRTRSTSAYNLCLLSQRRGSIIRGEVHYESSSLDNSDGLRLLSLLHRGSLVSCFARPQGTSSDRRRTRLRVGCVDFLGLQPVTCGIMEAVPLRLPPKAHQSPPNFAVAGIGVSGEGLLVEREDLRVQTAIFIESQHSVAAALDLLLNSILAHN